MRFRLLAERIASVPLAGAIVHIRQARRGVIFGFSGLRNEYLRGGFDHDLLFKALYEVAQILARRKVPSETTDSVDGALKTERTHTGQFFRRHYRTASCESNCKAVAIYFMLFG